VARNEDDGGGGGGGGGGVARHAVGGGAAGGGGGGGGALLLGGALLTPETQQPLACGAGTLFFSQQRALGPCTPGFTYVKARHCGSIMQVSRHCSGLGVRRSKLR
jgi:hypothetical protein